MLKVLVVAYLRGQIPRKRFLAQVGEERFKSLWQKLSAMMQEIEEAVVRQSPPPPDVPEETVVEAMAVANSFLLWNLPHGYGAGPTTQGRMIRENLWLFPIVLTSPGYGIVGEVGHIVVDMAKRQIIGCTPLDTVRQRGGECYEAKKEEIMAAFLQARTV
jgi:hypothetical protein